MLSNNTNTLIPNLYQILAENLKLEVDMNILKTSESIRTIQLSSGNLVSVSLHRFTYGILRNAFLAEIFYTDLEDFNKPTYLELITKLLTLEVDFLVILSSLHFFSVPIKDDNYLEGKELYLHSYNLYIPDGYNNIQLPVF